MRARHYLRIAIISSVLALLSLNFDGFADASDRLNAYSKILVFSEGEDATSIFDYIYLFDEDEKIAVVIQSWNGGCCQAPLIEEFDRVGDAFVHRKSYQLDERPDNLPKAILCNDGMARVVVEPTHSAIEGFKVDEIEGYHLEEALRIKAC